VQRWKGISGPNVEIVCWSKKGGQHHESLIRFLQERREIFQFIKDNYTVYPIEKMCNVFKVSKSGYYGWLNTEPFKRAIENQEILQQIRLIHKESGQTGSQLGLGLRSMVTQESVKP
jgi:hypothetical protein